MERITDAWEGLERRQQALAGSVAASVVLLVLALLVVGRDEAAPVDGSTTTAAAAASEPVVPPTPGMIVSSNVPPDAAAAATGGGGVAPLTASEGGGGDVATDGEASDAEARELHEEAARSWRDVDAELGVYQPPSVSGAAKAAGRDLERAARDYVECVEKAHKGDIRHCPNVLKYGVSITSTLHYDGRGVTLTKESTDGHRLDYTITPKGGKCRVLDLADSCSGWVSQ